MHIPYGLLDNPATLLTTNAIAAAGVTWSFSRLKVVLASRLVPLLASTSAFIFAAQMVNFPIGAGTSGHLIGGTLAAVLLGPWGATAAISLVLVVQCFLFGDGGLLELGANVINMAIVGGAGSWCVYRVLSMALPATYRVVGAAAAAAWISVVAASACCSIALAAAGTTRLGPTLAAMVGVHSIIGIGEAAITALVVAALWKLRPDLIDSAFARNPTSRIPFVPTLVTGMFLAGTVAAFLAPVASELPDGLEAVAKSMGFVDREIETPLIPTPIHDYQMPGLGVLYFAKSAAGLVGVLAVATLAMLSARAIAKSDLAATQPASS